MRIVLNDEIFFKFLLRLVLINFLTGFFIGGFSSHLKLCQTIDSDSRSEYWLGEEEEEEEGGRECLLLLTFFFNELLLILQLALVITVYT